MSVPITRRLAIINKQTKVDVATVQDWVQAVGIQVNRDVAATWGVGATVKYVAPTGTVPAGYWQVALLDNADQAGVLGYHDLTKEGLPLGKVFVQTAISYGDSPSVTLSHEVLEMIADPFVADVVMDGIDPLTFWARELCDAVESDALGYDITLPATATKPTRKVRVSDFVLPDYFNTLTGNIALPGPFSFKRNVTSPSPALAPGGYMAFVRNGVWSQVTRFETKEGTPAHLAEMARKRIDGPLDRRRILRQIPRAQWIRSAQ
jgi:hypothetical protein